MNDVEVAVLISSLQGGMSAGEALQTAPFHSPEQRFSLISELNARLKTLKGRMKHASQSASASTSAIISSFWSWERNARLVIGKTGGWNRLLPTELLEEFALGQFLPLNLKFVVSLAVKTRSLDLSGVRRHFHKTQSPIHEIKGKTMKGQ